MTALRPVSPFIERLLNEHAALTGSQHHLSITGRTLHYEITRLVLADEATDAEAAAWLTAYRPAATATADINPAACNPQPARRRRC